MAPLPDPKAEPLPDPLPEEAKKNVPSALSLLGKGFSTVTATVGTFLGGVAFFNLLKNFIDDLRLRASKVKAQQKIEEMQNQADEEDAETVTGEGTKKLEPRPPHVRRQVEWDSNGDFVLE